MIINVKPGSAFNSFDIC